MHAPKPLKLIAATALAVAALVAGIGSATGGAGSHVAIGSATGGAGAHVAVPSGPPSIIAI